jgi:5'-3' exonuclease
MGVPKFFRWMSERYPGISQLIAENRIPEFDCLYVGSLAHASNAGLTMNPSST